MRLLPDECWSRLRAAEHGVLCTVSATLEVAAVPACFAVVDDAIVSPIDTIKPKETTELGRLANLERDPSAALLCEHWDADDWSQLWWVRATLQAVGQEGASAAFWREGEEALRAKYVQYRDAEFAHLLAFDVPSVIGWQAAPA